MVAKHRLQLDAVYNSFNLAKNHMVAKHTGYTYETLTGFNLAKNHMVAKQVINMQS